MIVMIVTIQMVMIALLNLYVDPGFLLNRSLQYVQIAGYAFQLDSRYIDSNRIPKSCGKQHKVGRR